MNSGRFSDVESISPTGDFLENAEMELDEQEAARKHNEIAKNAKCFMRFLFF